LTKPAMRRTRDCNTIGLALAREDGKGKNKGEKGNDSPKQGQESNSQRSSEECAEGMNASKGGLEGFRRVVCKGHDKTLFEYASPVISPEKMARKTFFKLRWLQAVQTRRERIIPDCG